MSKGLLYQINSPEDLRKLAPKDLPELALALRRFIIDIVAVKEGHLGASLGVVELTIALHYSFNTPEDKLIWDVGHQAYGHKILTGRRDIFETNRQYGGISGFPRISESPYDTFGTGHSSTSISSALGMALAAQLNNDYNRQHIAVIGDASIASGMAFEALNHVGATGANLLVVLNDNAMGIDPSVGAFKEYLGLLKNEPNSAQTFFEALNIKHSGPVDGHNIALLLQHFEELKKMKGPRLLHVITTKGKGLKQAETDQIKYHAPGRFNAKTGIIDAGSAEVLPPKFQDVFGHTLVALAEKNKKIVGITPAMPTGSSLKYMIQAFPERAFDVGIAEQHAVTLAAGLAREGFVVFCNIYSTFLQRAYDQLIHDVALQGLPVIFCIDRAGIVGEDGATHHGVFDIAYLSCIPNLMIYAPRNEETLRNIMYTAQCGLELPIAIRYPRGRGFTIDWETPLQETSLIKAEELVSGKELAILATGTLTQTALEIASRFKDQVAVYYFGFIKPLDLELLEKVFKDFSKIITLEDGVKRGGFGSAIAEVALEKNYNEIIKILGIPDRFLEHGTVEELQKDAGIDRDSIEKIVRNML